MHEPGSGRELEGDRPRRGGLSRLLILTGLPFLVVVGVIAAAGFAWVAALIAVAGAAWIIARREREILTERVRLQAAEAKSWQTQAAWLRAALDNMPDAVVVADEHARPQVFNPAAERMLGLGATDDPPSQWSARYGTYYADGVTPYPSEKLPMVRALGGEDADEPDMFLRNERRDGLWLSASARPLRREDGTPWGAVLVCHDMTERKRAVEEIRRLNTELESRVRARTASLQAANDQLAREIEERKQMEAEVQRSEGALSALVESTNDAVWSVDRNYQVVKMNSAMKSHFTRVFGALQPGGSFGAHLSDEQRRNWRALYDRVFAGERVTTERTVKVGGVTQHFLISISPIREGTEVTGATVFSHDISDLRHTEELARAHQAELTHVLRLGTLGEIASALAHEINQPLGAIANYAGACSRWVESGTTRLRDLQHGLEMIAAEALRAGEIIRRLRDLARKAEGSVQAVDVNGIVCRAAALMEPETRLRGIALRVEPANDLPQVCADGIQIEQVVLNLLLNGVEAMQTSAVKELSVSTASNNGHVVVSVRDSGVGLEPSIREHVFDAYFTTKTNGLGMGLAISRRIVDAHGGQLCGEPNAGGPGSTFSFSLPVAPL